MFLYIIHVICLLIPCSTALYVSIVGLPSDNPGFVCPGSELWTEEVEPSAEDIAYFQDQENQRLSRGPDFRSATSLYSRDTFLLAREHLAAFCNSFVFCMFSFIASRFM